MSSAFKNLYSSMINSGGNLSTVQNEFKDKKIKCFVKESFPFFLVTDNHFYVPCYFTKKAVDDFKGKHSGVNISELKSKVIEIGDWSLEMKNVDSSSVFTSYAGIEIRLIVNSFKLVAGTKEKVLLSRYPVNLYRDDEMKTLFQAYHHKQLQSKVTCKDCLPDVTKKGESVMSIASGNKFAYGFKAGNTQAVDMASIFKTEKGSAAYAKLQAGSSSTGGGVKVTSKVKSAKKSKKRSGTMAATLQAASQIISKVAMGDAKRSVAKVGGKSAPGLKTPKGTGSSRATPGVSKKSFDRMKAFLKSKGSKK